MFNIRNIIPNMMSKLPKNEIKHRIVIDLGESYTTLYRKLEEASDADCQRVIKTASKIFESFNKAIEYDEKK